MCAQCGCEVSRDKREETNNSTTDKQNAAEKEGELSVGEARRNLEAGLKK